MLQAECKLIRFELGCKGRCTLGCLAELVSLTAAVASLLTLPAAVFKNHHTLGYEFEYFCQGLEIHTSIKDQVNSTLFSSGLGITRISKVWVIKHHRDNTRGRVPCKPQGFCVCALSLLQLVYMLVREWEGGGSWRFLSCRSVDW